MTKPVMTSTIAIVYLEKTNKFLVEKFLFAGYPTTPANWSDKKAFDVFTNNHCALAQIKKMRLYEETLIRTAPKFLESLSEIIHNADMKEEEAREMGWISVEIPRSAITKARRIVNRFKKITMD